MLSATGPVGDINLLLGKKKKKMLPHECFFHPKTPAHYSQNKKKGNNQGDFPLYVID
jgi:hypothetical protein